MNIIDDTYIFLILVTFVLLAKTDSVNSDHPELQLEPSLEEVTLQCAREVCLDTLEWNPICGSNGILYGNPGTFKCAQECYERNSKSFLFKDSNEKIS